MSKLKVAHIDKSCFELEGIPDNYLMIVDYAKEYATTYTEFIEFFHLGVDAYKSFCRGKSKLLCCYQTATCFAKMVIRSTSNEKSGIYVKWEHMDLDG